MGGVGSQLSLSNFLSRAFDVVHVIPDGTVAGELHVVVQWCWYGHLGSQGYCITCQTPQCCELLPRWTSADLSKFNLSYFLRMDLYHPQKVFVFQLFRLYLIIASAVLIL